MESSPRVVYCIDTSSLVTIQRLYPLAVFPGLWKRLEGLAYEGRLVAPHEVLRELEKGSDDEILRWAKGHQAMFRELDAEQAEIVSSIVNNPKYNGLFDVDGEFPDADPFVVALATWGKRRPSLLGERWVVVADEARSNPGKKPRIPDVCSDPTYNVTSVHVLDLFKSEGWQFPES